MEAHDNVGGLASRGGSLVGAVGEPCSLRCSSSLIEVSVVLFMFNGGTVTIVLSLEGIFFGAPHDAVLGKNPELVLLGVVVARMLLLS